MAIDDVKFRIVKAVYGTINNEIDVTREYEKHIANGRIDVVVSNEIAKNDPDQGFPKLLTIQYLNEGKEQTKQAKEGSRIQLP